MARQEFIVEAGEFDGIKFEIYETEGKNGGRFKNFRIYREYEYQGETKKSYQFTFQEVGRFSQCFKAIIAFKKDYETKKEALEKGLVDLTMNVGAGPESEDDIPF